jgi:hypothetical protein
VFSVPDVICCTRLVFVLMGFGKIVTLSAYVGIEVSIGVARLKR